MRAAAKNIRTIFFFIDIFSSLKCFPILFGKREFHVKYHRYEVLTNMRLTHAVTRETIFRAKSKKQPLGEQMNLPVREAQSATSSLPYGNTRWEEEREEGGGEREERAVML